MAQEGIQLRKRRILVALVAPYLLAAPIYIVWVRSLPAIGLSPHLNWLALFAIFATAAAFEVSMGPGTTQATQGVLYIVAVLFGDPNSIITANVAALIFRIAVRWRMRRYTPLRHAGNIIQTSGIQILTLEIVLIAYHVIYDARDPFGLPTITAAISWPIAIGLFNNPLHYYYSRNFGSTYRIWDEGLDVILESASASVGLVAAFLLHEDALLLPLLVLPLFLISMGQRVAIHIGRQSQDLAAEADQIAILEMQTRQDALTGLFNRVAFDEQARSALARRARSQHVLAVFFVDLDAFKDVNDLHGHAVGDRVLTSIADRMGLCIRAGDLCARFGGDEFAVLLEDAGDRDGIIATAHRLITAISAPLQISTGTVGVGASVGVAIVEHKDTVDVEELLRRADSAMYAAKTGGKGRVALWEPLSPRILTATD